MRRNVLFLAVGVVLLSGCLVKVNRQDGMPKIELLRHVVLLKFKDSSTRKDIKDVEKAFRALPRKINVIYDFEWGTDVSVENLQQGYTHCFLVTFLNEDDRAIYLPHPAHKEFGEILGPHLDKVLVIDYWSKE